MKLRVAAVLVIALGVAAYRGLNLTRGASDSQDVASPADSSEQPTRAAASAGDLIRILGRPTDPLPERLDVGPLDPDAAAALLAKTVMAGGADALPALLTALSKSGFAVYGPDDAVAIPPEGPDAGLFFESWQARAMAGAIGSRKHVSIPLSGLASGIELIVPALKGQPVGQLLVAGIVENANSDEPSRRLWSRFIVELGKQSHSYDSYDLLATTDPNAVRLDLIQMTLITRRLAADFGTVSAPAVAANPPRRWPSLFPVVYASEPCVPNGPRPRPKSSRSAFGQLVHTLTGPGRAMGDLVRPNIANSFDFAMLSLMLSALKVEAELEGANPLRRTKTTTAGEARKIRGIVSLDGTPLEWANCYRAWLNSQGRELAAYPRANGPVPNVAVDFNLDGRAIVRIPTSASPDERGLPGATKTDSQGIARLAVEGTPQDRNLRDPSTEQRKTAKVIVTANVKMSDLLTRGHPAGGSGPVDIVHQWVSEQEFRIDVPYEFEVIDWSDTPGRWSGTLSVVETTISESSGRGTFDMGAHTLQETETIEMKVEVLNTISEYPMSGLQASLTGRMEGRYSLLKTYASWQKKSCAQIANRPMNNTSRDRSGGSGQADATITVNVFDDGQYVIAAGADGFSIPITGEFSSELEVFRSGAHGCTVEMKTESRPHAPMSRAAGGLIQINGRVDPNNRNVLSGSTTENSGSGGEKRVKTTTWSFRRQ